MDQEDPRRTAGAGAGAGRTDDQVRDWQRNTWFGPSPYHTGNPFDEPDDAPELRDSRSPNVNDHVGEFWQQDSAGYQFGDAQKGQGKRNHRRAGKNGTGRQQTDVTGAVPPVRNAKNRAGGRAVSEKDRLERRNRSGRGVKALFITLGAVIVLLLIARYAVFSIREIRVIGNVSVTDEDVIRVSGIRQGDSILSLDEKYVEKRVESDYRLQFRYLAKALPSSVTLAVREREACCWLTYGGILYTMDKNRMVMTETENLDELPAGLVEVKGLNIRSGCGVGQTMMLSTQDQQNIFRNLFLEMKVLGCTGLILEADLSNAASLLMQTREGFMVSLGNYLDLHAKLRSMLLVRSELIRRGLSGGIINVSNPVSPVYSPPKGE